MGNELVSWLTWVLTKIGVTGVTLLDELLHFWVEDGNLTGPSGS